MQINAQSTYFVLGLEKCNRKRKLFCIKFVLFHLHKQNMHLATEMSFAQFCTFLHIFGYIFLYKFVHFCTFLICLLQFWDLLMFLFQLKANFSVHQIIIGHFKQYLLCNCILYYIRVVYIFVSWVYIYLNEIYVGLNVEMPEFVSL